MKKNNNTGFTLIEIIVVVVIMGILTAIAVPVYTSIMQSQASQAAYINLQTIYEAEKNYTLSNSGNYCITDNSNDSGGCAYRLDHIKYNLNLESMPNDTYFNYACYENITSTGVECVASPTFGGTVSASNPDLCYPLPANADGTCPITCTPSCPNAACGESDGCGGKCQGVCPTVQGSPAETCQSGQCVSCLGNCSDGQCHQENYEYCGNNCSANCTGNNYCSSSTQCSECFPSCPSCVTTANTVSNQCGGYCPVSNCGANQLCISGSCVNACYGVTCGQSTGAYYPANTTICDQECTNQYTCESNGSWGGSGGPCPGNSSSPYCAGKQCGPDGLNDGALCGSGCSAGEYCNLSTGQCLQGCQTVECGVGPVQLNYGDYVCAGGCGAYFQCTSSGLVSAGICPTGPKCGIHNCGPDYYGDPTGSTCGDNSCSTVAGCSGGACTCSSNGVCTPTSCVTNVTCGTIGGVNCGACSSGYVCVNNQCDACIPNCLDGICHSNSFTDLNNCQTNDCSANCSNCIGSVNGNGGTCQGACIPSCPTCNTNPLLSDGCGNTCPVCSTYCLPSGYCYNSNCTVDCSGVCSSQNYTDKNNCSPNDCLANCTSGDSCQGSLCCSPGGNCFTPSS